MMVMIMTVLLERMVWTVHGCSSVGGEWQEDLVIGGSINGGYELVCIANSWVDHVQRQ